MRLSLIILFIAYAAMVSTVTAASVPKLPANPTVLEISTRPWLYKLSKQYGRSIVSLRDIPMEEFQKIRQRGIDMVWMMGVWRLGEYGVQHDRTDPGLWFFFPLFSHFTTHATQNLRAHIPKP